MRFSAFLRAAVTLGALGVGPALLSAGHALAAEFPLPPPPLAIVVVPPEGTIFDTRDPAAPKPPRRALTTYMARYPFGVLREDYTPLGTPGVSKRDYYGPKVMTATLHAAVRERRVAKRVATRKVLRVRY